MEWNSRFLIFAIYGNAKDEWNSAESKRSMAEDARENKKNDIPFEHFDTIKNNIVIEAMALVLSGDLDKIDDLEQKDSREI